MVHGTIGLVLIPKNLLFYSPLLNTYSVILRNGVNHFLQLYPIHNIYCKTCIFIVFQISKKALLSLSLTLHSQTTVRGQTREVLPLESYVVTSDHYLFFFLCEVLCIDFFFRIFHKPPPTLHFPYMLFLSYIIPYFPTTFFTAF